MFDALVLAGANKITPLTEAENVTNKAFIMVNGRTILSYVLQALRSCPQIGRIAVVGPADALAEFVEPYNILPIQEKGGITDNIHAGSLMLQPQRHFLLVSGDIPLLTAEALADFLEQCHPYKYDFYYPIVSKDDNDQRFPGMVRTYVRLKDGVFTGGNIFLVNSAKVEAGLPRVNRFIELRKSPLRLLQALGPWFVFKFVTRRLTIGELERNFPRLVGVSGKAVFCRYPEIGTDVDKPSDLELIRRELDKASES